MKRLFFCAGIAFTVGIFSCAQHDTKSPDSAGGYSTEQPGVGVDTTQAQTGTQTTTGPTDANNANDHSNNNQQVNTGDSSMPKK